MKSIEMTANSYDEAVSLALAELGLTAEQVDVENLKESGLIRKKYTVRVTQKITTDIIAKNFVQGVIDKIGLECTAEVTEDDTAITVTLSGKDANVLIGYRGEALDSLQYLTLLVANKSNPAGKRIVLDGENYREKRTVTLSKLAKKLAFSAAKNCEVINLEPMNPFERRIIHSALHDDKFVTTSSVGEEPNRYVVITPNRKERRPYDPNRAPRDKAKL
ncbi:MAG: RNA-binding cell elongation regulator Jag/EloR [Clostridia bacterium]